MKIGSAIYSGLCAAFASFFGKISGLDLTIFSVMWRCITKTIFFVMMLLLNSIGWTSFVRSVQNSRAVVAVTAVSTSTNYAVSGMLAFIFFNETTGALWWMGVTLIVLGGIIVSCSSRQRRRNLRSLPNEADETIYLRGVTEQLPLRNR